VISQRIWNVDDFGLAPVRAAELAVSGPLESATRIKAMLAGETGPVRDVVLANSAAALWVAGRAGRRARDRLGCGGAVAGPLARAQSSRRVNRSTQISSRTSYPPRRSPSD